jgi:hypothetical protein
VRGRSYSARRPGHVLCNVVSNAPTQAGHAGRRAQEEEAAWNDEKAAAEDEWTTMELGYIPSLIRPRRGAHRPPPTATALHSTCRGGAPVPHLAPRTRHRSFSLFAASLTDQTG